MNECPTVRIKADRTNENQLGYIVINESDFDKATMKLFDKVVAAPVAQPAPEATAPPDIQPEAPKAPWTPQ